MLRGYTGTLQKRTISSIHNRTHKMVINWAFPARSNIIVRLRSRLRWRFRVQVLGSKVSTDQV